MSTMVLGSFIKDNESGTSTSTSGRILIKEELICSSDERINTQSSSSNLFTEQNEWKTKVGELKMFAETIVNDNSISAAPSIHEGNLVINENDCIKFSSLSNDDDTVTKDIEVLKDKLHRVLKKRDQYRRRVESLTNGIIALRGAKLVLERKIIGAKLSWDIKQNKKLKS